MLLTGGMLLITKSPKSPRSAGKPPRSTGQPKSSKSSSAAASSVGSTSDSDGSSMPPSSAEKKGRVKVKVASRRGVLPDGKFQCDYAMDGEVFALTCVPK